jgi:hypothetical protein
MVKIKSVNQDSQSSRFFHDLFTSFGFLLYALADFLGRVSAARKQVIPNTRRERPPVVVAPVSISVCAGGHLVLAALVTLRLVFIPLFLLCNVVPDKGYSSSAC